MDSWEYRAVTIVLDIGRFRLFQPVRSDTPITETKPGFMKIKFNNKGIDAINLSSILHNKLVPDKIPVYFKFKSPPIISYEYSKTIASKIFNYKPVLSDLNLTDFKRNPPSCDCSSSPYNYMPHGHVITGDLSIIPHDDLRSLMMKGPKYREPNNINWKKNQEMIFKAIDLYAVRWARKEDTSPEILDDWKESVKSLVTARISKVKTSISSHSYKVLEQENAKECLDSLHDKYVFVPADKAANNIIILCRK